MFVIGRFVELGHGAPPQLWRYSAAEGLEFGDNLLGIRGTDSRQRHALECLLDYLGLAAPVTG
jgi:hypothetical protein